MLAYIIVHLGDNTEFSSEQLPAELKTHIGHLSMSGRAKQTRKENGKQYYRLTQQGITYGKRWAESEGVL